MMNGGQNDRYVHVLGGCPFWLIPTEKIPQPKLFIFIPVSRENKCQQNSNAYMSHEHTHSQHQRWASNVGNSNQRTIKRESVMVEAPSAIILNTHTPPHTQHIHSDTNMHTHPFVERTKSLKFNKVVLKRKYKKKLR